MHMREKPADAFSNSNRSFEKHIPFSDSRTSVLLSMDELCKLLSISSSTGKNWLKSGKLVPSEISGKTPYFTQQYAGQLKQALLSGSIPALKSRRNKKYIAGSSIYRSYLSCGSANYPAVQKLLSLIYGHDSIPLSSINSLVLAECALRLFCRRNEISHDFSRPLLTDYLRGKLDISPYACLIDDLIPDSGIAFDTVQNYSHLFCIPYKYNDGEDLLGLLYLSLKNIGSRKASGAYYTPMSIAAQLIKHLAITAHSFQEMNLLDPCCGTGSFFTHLPESVRLEQVFGMDIDPDAIKLARINLALRYRPQNTDCLYNQIKVSDFLRCPPSKTFHCIFGNPPWGYQFNEKQSEYFKKQFQCAAGKTTESYDLFLEQALKHLETDGILSFILPEAVLNVKTHAPIRKQLLKQTSLTMLDYLGNPFGNVQCPCIILELKNTKKPLSTPGLYIKNKNTAFTIHTNRDVSADCFHFTAADLEYSILKKLTDKKKKTTLLHQADFALGIVTGNNKKYISRTAANHSEPILKGSDIHKFRPGLANHYIQYTPEQFQQTAPEAYYRAPEKLLYRFICSQLVFAYDHRQTLSLNSCNIVIPKVDGLAVKYILAVLNSRMTQFVFYHQFHSIKVLRSHIEQLPIPLADSSEQELCIQLVDQLLAENHPSAVTALYNELDQILSGFYQLSDEEYAVVKASLDGQNLFLF